MKRNETIDYLRGLAIFFMILVHSSVYFLTNNYMKFIWNFSEWSVAGFIFTSAYIFLENPKLIFWENKKFRFDFYFKFFLKRLKRLLMPFYIFIAFFSISYLIVNHNFFSFSYLLKSVFLIGGTDISWLVLLFVILSSIMPFIKYIFYVYKKLFYFIFCLVFVALILFLFIHNLSFNYKFIFWLEWSFIVFYNAVFVKFEKSKFSKLFLFLSIIIFGLSFLLTGIYLKINNLSLNQIDNKYPPNLYHISFGLLGVLGFYLLVKLGVFNLLKRFLFFLSKYSYSIFFIHYAILYATAYFFVKNSNWFLFVIFVLGATLIVQKLFNLIK